MNQPTAVKIETGSDNGRSRVFSTMVQPLNVTVTSAADCVQGERLSRPSDAGKSPPSRPPSRRTKKQVEEKSTTEPLEVIVLGADAAARQSYFSALRSLQLAKVLVVRAIVEPSENVRTEAAHFFPEAAHVGSVEAISVAAGALAILASPPRFHGPQTTSALKRGWHVLCASPLAPSAHEGALMIAAAQRHERLLAIDLRSRFYPAARYVRVLCRDFLIGPPLSFEAHIGRPRLAPEGTGGAVRKFEHPDGALSNLGVPALDLLTWCLGTASIVSYADDAMGGVEANARIELSFGDGVRGTVHLSHDWPTENAYTFVFERGIVRWAADRPNALTLQLASAPDALEGELVTPLSPVLSLPSAHLLSNSDQACVAQLENFMAAIAGRDTLRTPATEAMHALPLLEECYARRTPLLQPWLTRAEAVQARALCPPAALLRRRT
jgi:predicted dehydrogenase